MVVGHSKTGYIDKIDGMYFFTFLKKLREMLPPWMPTLGIEGGRINIVPVDYVADAMITLRTSPSSMVIASISLTRPDAGGRGAQYLCACRSCPGNDHAH